MTTNEQIPYLRASAKPREVWRGARHDGLSRDAGAEAFDPSAHWLFVSASTMHIASMMARASFSSFSSLDAPFTRAGAHGWPR